MATDMNDYFKNRKRPESGGDGGGDKKGGFEPPEFLKDLSKKAGLLYVVIGLVALLVIFKPFVIINSGEVGIKVTAGKFDTTPLEPGFHMYLPILQKVIVVDTKVRIINYKANEDLGGDGKYDEGIRVNPAINVLDTRGLPVMVELTVQYSLKPYGAPQTIAVWGLSWEEKIINPVVRDIVRNVVGSFTAEDLPNKRNEIAALIENGIRDNIEKLENKPVNLLSIQLREIVLPPKIKEQIEAVQVANQEAQRAKYEVDRVKQEAEKKIAAAKGEAEAIRIESEAQANANKIVGASLNNNLLRLEQIKTQGKFNEALKENKDAKIFLTPGGAVPNIWVDQKDYKQQMSSGGQ